MLSRKENLAAVSLFNPTKSPPVIVVPDLEEPGINAKDWATPIKKESATDISFISFLNFAVFSAIARIMASPIKLPEITYRFFVNEPSIISLNSSPIITTGIVPIIISHPSLESSSCSENFFLEKIFCLKKELMMLIISFQK